MPPHDPPAAPLRRRRAAELVALVALGVAAIALRLWSAYHARLSPEEAWFWNTGVGIARGEHFPALGHPVSGTHALHPGPLFFWIIAASQVFVTSPLVANFFVSSFGLLGVLCLARTLDGRESPSVTGGHWAFGSEGALFALFLLAAPWWIIYTNSTWPGYVMTGTTAFFVAGLLQLVARPRSRAAMGVGFLLVAGFQIHLSLLHYWPLALAVFVLFRPRLNLRWLAAGALLGAACYVPYLVHELRTHFSNTRLLMAKSQGGSRDARTLLGLYLHFFGFATTDLSFLWQQGFWRSFDHLRFWRGDGVRQTTAFFRTAGPVVFLWAMHGLSWLVSVVALGTGLGRVILAWRRGARRPTPLLAVYVVALLDIAAFYGLSGKGGYAHYVSVLLPVAYFPVASFLAWIARRSWGRAAVAGYLVAFAVAGVLVMRGYYRVDSRWSAPQIDRVVTFVLDRTRGPDGKPQPFEMTFGFSPSWSLPFEIVASRLHHAPWLARPGAPRRFFVGARDATPAPPGADRLDLETIFVIAR